MGLVVATFAEAYLLLWPLCLILVAFFAIVLWLLWRGRNTVPVATFDAMRAFWTCAGGGVLLLALCLTLIDKPLLGNTEESKEWLFMFSAFLGIPLAVPLFTGAAWALAHHQLHAPMQASPFGLILLGSFALGTAASNLHDVLWCATYTGGFIHHAAAGYDLDFFVAAGAPFGIDRARMADYATLGPFALLLVLGELSVAWTCISRILRQWA